MRKQIIELESLLVDAKIVMMIWELAMDWLSSVVDVLKKKIREKDAEYSTLIQRHKNQKETIKWLNATIDDLKGQILSLKK